MHHSFGPLIHDVVGWLSITENGPLKTRAALHDVSDRLICGAMAAEHSLSIFPTRQRAIKEHLCSFPARRPEKSFQIIKITESTMLKIHIYLLSDLARIHIRKKTQVLWCYPY